MEKAIHEIKSNDFLGYWESDNKYAKLFMNQKAYLTIGEKTYEGNLTVDYFKDCEECTNCLKLTLAQNHFYIKQIGQDGFFLTIEGGQIFLKKLS